MSELREKLKARAERKLNEMVDALATAAEGVCTGTDIEASTLCRIVSSPQHSKTLVNQSISTLVRRMESDLLERVDADHL